MSISALLAPVARRTPAVVVVALLAVLPASSTAYATFTPEFNVAVADTAPEVMSDLSFHLDLPNGDANFAGVAGFVPDDWGIVEGRDVPIGAIVGKVESRAALGFIGSACNIDLTIEFDIVNASVDIDDTVSFNDTDKADVDNTPDYAKDVNPANGLYDAFDKYPDFINRVFDTDNLQPIRRSTGITIIAGIPVLLQFLTFPPGTLIDESIPNDIALGYPTVALLQDFGDPQAEPMPAAITDFCTPLVSTATFFGVTKDDVWTAGIDEGGVPLLVNPQDGSYTFAVVSNGLRDADGDGYENALDTCPYDTNLGSPRISYDGGDVDADGLDAACDPNDDPVTGGTSSDEDHDGYLNRQDNCPLVKNGEDMTNQADADLDQIGDVCDQDPNIADGDLLTAQSTRDVAIGSGTGPGGPPDCPVPGCWSPPVLAAPNAKGNVDCDGDIDTVDALKELRYVAQLALSQTQPCPLIGTDGASLWGDVDCSGNVTSVDALKILRFVAQLPVSQTEPCSDIGTPAS